MNKEKILGVLLFMLSLSLAVVPIIAAFSAHGWDPMATVMSGSTPLENMMNMNLSENMMSLQSTSIDLPNSRLTATVQFTSPFNFSMKIENISGNVTCKDHGVGLGSVQLASKVKFPPNTSENLTINCTLTSDGIAHIVNQHGGAPPNNPGFENARFTIDVYGIVFEATLSL